MIFFTSHVSYDCAHLCELSSTWHVCELRLRKTHEWATKASARVCEFFHKRTPCTWALLVNFFTILHVFVRRACIIWCPKSTRNRFEMGQIFFPSTSEQQKICEKFHKQWEEKIPKWYKWGCSFLTAYFPFRTSSRCGRRVVVCFFCVGEKWNALASKPCG